MAEPLRKSDLDQFFKKIPLGGQIISPFPDEPPSALEAVERARAAFQLQPGFQPTPRRTAEETERLRLQYPGLTPPPLPRRARLIHRIRAYLRSLCPCQTCR